MNGQICQCFVFFHINYNDRTLWSAVCIHSTKYKYSGAERCIMISLYCYFDFYNVPIFHIDQAILFESQLFQKGKHKIVHWTTYCTSVLIKCSKIITSTHKYTFFLFNKHTLSNTHKILYAHIYMDYSLGKNWSLLNQPKHRLIAPVHFSN